MVKIKDFVKLCVLQNHHNIYIYILFSGDSSNDQDGKKNLITQRVVWGNWVIPGQSWDLITQLENKAASFPGTSQSPCSLGWQINCYFGCFDKEMTLTNIEGCVSNSHFFKYWAFGYSWSFYIYQVLGTYCHGNASAPFSPPYYEEITWWNICLIVMFVFLEILESLVEICCIASNFTQHL